LFGIFLQRRFPASENEKMGKDSRQIPDKVGTRAGMTKWMKDSGTILEEARTRARMTFSGQIKL